MWVCKSTRVNFLGKQTEGKLTQTHTHNFSSQMQLIKQFYIVLCAHIKCNQGGEEKKSEVEKCYIKMFT